MARTRWATAEQLEWLKAFLPDLEQEKQGNGLKTFYDSTAQKFLQRWPAKPKDKEREAAKDDAEAQALAAARRTKVCLRLSLLPYFELIDIQQIHDWFKNNKRNKTSQPSKGLLDLSGKSDRKTSPLQFHHAFSVRYHRDPDSPLRHEVRDLWERRNHASVIKLLDGFWDPKQPLDPLKFHNAVMWWKCSLLTPEQQQEHQEWIDQNTLEREEELKQPWKATRETTTEELSVENEYIQRYALFPPSTEAQADIILQLHRLSP